MRSLAGMSLCAFDKLLTCLVHLRQAFLERAEVLTDCTDLVPQSYEALGDLNKALVVLYGCILATQSIFKAGMEPPEKVFIKKHRIQQ